MESRKIYVASSWRNDNQPRVVDLLKIHGYQVYDFRHPQKDNNGFSWFEVDPDWKHWDAGTFRSAMNHPTAINGFDLDFQAMEWADIFIGVMPFGISASLEMGWAVGKGKKTILLLADGEPELMTKMIDHICVNVSEVLRVLCEWGRTNGL